MLAHLSDFQLVKIVGIELTAKMTEFPKKVAPMTRIPSRLWKFESKYGCFGMVRAKVSIPHDHCPSLTKC